MATSQLLPQCIIAAIESTPVPPLPQILLRLLEAVEDDAVSTAALSELIGRDPVLAARTIAAANSAAFRRGNEIIRIEDCVKVLGTRIVRTMATCLAVQHSFDPRSADLRADVRGFWRHSLLVAETARALAVECRAVRSDEAYLAGLLHDLGELLLVSVPEYAGLLAIAPDEATLRELEYKALGADHAAAGAWLADQWKLQSLLADAILFHHRTETEIATADPLSRLLWVAHAWIASGELPPATKALIGVAAADLVAPLKQARERVDRIATGLGLIETPTNGSLNRPFPVFATDSRGTSTHRGSDPEIDAAMRDLALMQPLQRALYALESDTEILFSLRESIRILFGIDQLAFLLFDSATASFRGAADDSQAAMLRRIIIPLDPATSIVALSAQRAEACGSPDQGASASLADMQLMRGLGAERLFCVPMLTSRQIVGVIACGLSQNQFARMGRHGTWLASFARLAARTLELWHGSRDRQMRCEAEIAGHFERRAQRIVHEAGNPLGIIKNYLCLLERKLPLDSPLHGDLAVIGEEIDRVARIVAGMGAPADASATDLNALVREMISFYDGALFSPRGITVQLSLADEPAHFTGDRDAVKQILLNLCKNAAAALDRGGRLLIGTGLGLFHDGLRYIELSVADDGPGLPADVQQRLMDRSSAPPAGPHGIGLSVVASLADRLGAKLVCKTPPGEGTSFRLLIPAGAMSAGEEMQ